MLKENVLVFVLPYFSFVTRGSTGFLDVLWLAPSCTDLLGTHTKHNLMVLNNVLNSQPN